MNQQEIINKAIKEKQKRIDKAIVKKEKSIAYFNSINSAISLLGTQASFISKEKKEKRDKAVKNFLTKWRDWFYNQWQEWYLENMVESEESEEEIPL